MNSIFLKSTSSVLVASLAVWAAVGHIPKAKNFHTASIQNFTTAAGELFKLSNTQAGTPGFTQNLVNLIRGSIGLVAGYGSRSAYVSLVCSNGVDPGANASCDGPPQVGIVGAATQIVNDLPTIAGNAGITSCETAPSSGTFTGTDSSGNSVSLVFSTPTHSIPQGWQGNGNLFSHRVVFGGTLTNIGPTPVTIRVAYEFNCGSNPASYVALSMAVDNAAGYVRDITVYNGVGNDDKKGIEVYMSEHNGSAVRGADIMRIAYDANTHLFDLWSLINTNIEPVSGQGTQMLSKVFANGNYVTGQALVFSRSIFSKALMSDPAGALDTAMSSYSGATDATVESDPGNHDMSTDLLTVGAVTGTAHGSPAGLSRMACINFNTPSASSAPNASACAGLSISAPLTHPAIDSSGTWGMNYLFNFSTHLEHVL